MKQWLYIVLLFAGALAVRLLVVFAFRDIHDGPVGEISADDVQYHHLAMNLAEGNGYRVTPDRPLTSFRAPGFPFVLALLYAAVGVEPAAAYGLFAVLGAAACVVTYLLARELLTETGARWAGGLAAIYLPHAYLASTFLSENIFVPCLGLALWFFVRHVRHGGLGVLVLAGVFLGYTTLTRPGTLLTLPLWYLVLAWRDYRDGRVRYLDYVVLPVAFFAAIVPWTIRNHAVHGHWVLISTTGGSTFWGGNNDRVLFETRSLGYWIPTNELPDRDQVDAARDEVERDQVEWRLGKAWVRAHLAWMPLLELYKFGRFWWLPEYGVGLRWLRVVSYVPFLVLFIAFAVRCAWRRAFWTPPWMVLHAAMLGILAVVLIFAGLSRFRDGQMPVLMVYAAAGLRPAWSRTDETPKAAEAA
jgi:4-amino-4-deoxy-L-arabinose transferase-like glycosyltransferase